MFGIKMPWTKRREALEAAKRRDEERAQHRRAMEAARKEHERYTGLLIQRERARAERAEREAKQWRDAQDSVRTHDLFGSPTPAIEFPRWPQPTSREWDSTAPAAFQAAGGSFDGGGASGDWKPAEAAPASDSGTASSPSSSGGSD